MNNCELPLEAKIVRTKENELLDVASSGGFISSFCEWFIRDYKGIIFAVEFDDNFSVVHKEIRNLEEVRSIAGSKYVQSRLGDSFKRIKMYLIDGVNILFIGTPCQVAGLKSFLQKDYENLLTIDFVCHGVASDFYWKTYKKYMMDRFGSNIVDVSFRDKSIGYRSTRMRIKFENGKIYQASPRVDYMLNAFYSNFVSRPACSECRFKSYKHISDITCFDSWKAEEICKECSNDNKGYTNVILNSRKGVDFLIKATDYFECHAVEIERIIPKGGGMILNSAVPNRKRDEFNAYYKNNGIENSAKMYLGIKTRDYLIEHSKHILFKMGVLSMTSKLKRRMK